MKSSSPSSDRANQEIVARLGPHAILSEFTSLGVRVAGDPRATGKVACYAIDREDHHPSAWIDTTTGRYGDSADPSGSQSLSLWDFALKHAPGKFSDWKAARQHYADMAGVDLTARSGSGGNGSSKNGKASSEASKLEFEEWTPGNLALAGLWCAIHKPGTSVEAIREAGGMIAIHYGRKVIALPAYGPDLLGSKPPAWVCYGIDGKPLKAKTTKDGPLDLVKIKSVGPTGNVLLGESGIRALFESESIDIVFKTAGPSDMLALLAKIPPVLRDKYPVITNANGEGGEVPAVAVKLLTGRRRRVVVIHDADQAGQAGVKKWVKRLGKSCQVGVVKLPFEVTDNHGKDLRDYLRDHSFEDLLALAQEALAEAPAASRGGESAGDGDGGSAESGATWGDRVTDPYHLARRFLASRPYMRFHLGEYYDWSATDAVYRKLETRAIGAAVSLHCRHEFEQDCRRRRNDWNGSGDEPVCERVTRTLVGDVVAAIESLTRIEVTEVPAWIKAPEGVVGTWAPGDILACQNGLIHLPSLLAGEPSMVEPTPDFFATSTLSFGYDSEAKCVEWLKALDTIWPGDPQAIRLLQQWFGYCLVRDTRHHKLMCLIGAPRSGKGVISRILMELVGPANVATSTFTMLSHNFGLSGLIGKSLVLFPDARIGKLTDKNSVTERILSITGGDTQPVERKYLSTASVRITAKFMVATNEMPDLEDMSQALAARFLFLRTGVSFVGREDLALESRLRGELPGILNWALGGWEDLLGSGKFIEPESSRSDHDAMTEVSSPVSQFVSENCNVDDQGFVECKKLYELWREWCEEQGKKSTGPLSIFSRNLKSVIPSLKISRVRDDGSRNRFFCGISLK